MTKQELTASAKEIERAIEAGVSLPLTAEERAKWDRAKRGRGRPRIGRGARRIMFSIEVGLLLEADRLAKKKGITRSQLVADGIRAIIEAERVDEIAGDHLRIVRRALDVYEKSKRRAG